MYIPKQGDIILMDFDPQSGHEQKGRRPACVVSNYKFNSFTNAAIVCPIANTDRGIPIQPKLDSRTKTQGVIMCDQVQSLDIVKRNAVYLETLPEDILFDISDIVNSFIEIITIN